jgi:hypothetical protein
VKQILFPSCDSDQDQHADRLYLVSGDSGKPCLQNLLELVSSEMAAEHCQADATLLTFYENTLQHIRSQKAKDDDSAKRYEEITV